MARGKPVRKFNGSGFSLGGVLFLGLIGLGAFFMGQLLSSGAPDAAADPGDELTYGDTVKRLLEEDALKPRFRGVLNGITLGQDAGQDSPASMSPKCTGTNSVTLRDVKVPASDLDFDLAYLPPRTKPGYIVANMCDGDMFLVERGYELEGGGLLQVTRKKGPASYPESASVDRVKATIVGGRSAVISYPVIPLDYAAIHFRDDGTSWEVSSMNLSVDQLVKVAEGVRAR